MSETLQRIALIKITHGELSKALELPDHCKILEVIPSPKQNIVLIKIKSLTAPLWREGEELTISRIEDLK